MMFLNEEHKEEWAAAVEKAGALTDYDVVKGDFAASLFVLTGVTGLYRRAELDDEWEQELNRKYREKARIED